MKIIKKPTCCVCKKPLKFRFAIEPTVASVNDSEKQFGPHRIYCYDHFFEELKKIMSPLHFGFIFCEPTHPLKGLEKISQNFYYTPEHMSNHRFSEEDILDTQELLVNIPDKRIFWIDSDMTFDAVIPPLFKEKTIVHEIITHDEFLIKMRNIFAPERLPKAGTYEINLPYDKPGIYIYYNYI